MAPIRKRGGGVLLVLVVAHSLVAAVRSTYDREHLADAEEYLTGLGVQKGLPQLEVKYKVGVWGRKVELEGSDTHLDVKDLQARPIIQWEKMVGDQDGTPAKFTLLMVNPDNPIRGKRQDELPFIHWVGFNCADSAESCFQAVPYSPPTPLVHTGKHRYIFLLFQQTAPPPSMDVITKYMQVQSRHKWDLPGFMEAMSCCMVPYSFNYFYASFEGPPKAEKESEEEVKERYLRSAQQTRGPSRLTPGPNVQTGLEDLVEVSDLASQTIGGITGGAARAGGGPGRAGGGPGRATPPPAPHPLDHKGQSRNPKAEPHESVWKEESSSGSGALGPGWDPSARPKHDEL